MKKEVKKLRLLQDAYLDGMNGEGYYTASAVEAGADPDDDDTLFYDVEWVCDVSSDFPEDTVKDWEAPDRVYCIGSYTSSGEDESRYKYIVVNSDECF